MDATRQKLLEHFDEEVIEKLRVSRDDSEAYLNRYERMVMDLTRAELDGHAHFEDEASFRLLGLPASVEGDDLNDSADKDLWVDFSGAIDQKCVALRREISQRNAEFFEAEAAKLDAWADDLKVGLEREIKDLDRQIKEARRGATAAPTLEEKLHVQKQIRALESQRGQKRRALFDAQDDIDRKRDQLIEDMAGKLEQRETRIELLRIWWMLV